MVNDGPHPSEELARQIGAEIDRALQAQTPEVRRALEQTIAEHGVQLRWEPPEHPRKVTALVGGHELVEIHLVRPPVH